MRNEVLWDEVRGPDYQKAAQFVQAGIRDELMEEFVGCVAIGCDVVALEGEMGVYSWEIMNVKSIFVLMTLFYQDYLQRRLVAPTHLNIVTT
jgi:hypothetical protein